MRIREVNDERELRWAINSGESEFIVEGEFAERLLKLQAKARLLFAAGCAALGVALFMACQTMRPIVEAIGTVSAMGAAALVLICVAGGGMLALRKLRGYRIVKISDTKIKVLK